MARLKGADFNASVHRDAKGRFTKAGASLSAARSRDRSLADAVLGTAESGPKRQRETPRFAQAGAALRAAKSGKPAAAPGPTQGRSASGVDLSQVRGLGVFSLDPEVRAAAHANLDADARKQASAEDKLRAAGKLGPAPSEAEIADRRQGIARATNTASDLYRADGQNGLAELAAAHQAPARKRAPAKKASPARGKLSSRSPIPRSAKETFLRREAALDALRPKPKPALRNEDNLTKFGAGSAMIENMREGPLSARRPQPAAAQGRHPGYDGLEPRELDLILSDNGVDATGMSLDQKRAALAARDQRLGISRFGLRPGESVSTPDRKPAGSLDRTEIGGWKGGRSTTPTDSLATARAATNDARQQLADAIVNAPSRAAARDALSRLPARELRALADHLGATVGSRDTKPRLIDRLAEIPGRRLDSAAITSMVSGAPQITRTAKAPTRNTWGATMPGDKVSYHPDSEIGRLVNSLGDDKQISIDGEPLADALGRAMTDSYGGRSAADTIGRLRGIATHLPVGNAARRRIEQTADSLDAPSTPTPAVPANTPQPLRDLMERLHAIPVVRRDGREEQALLDILARYEGRAVNPRVIASRLGSLRQFRHESDLGKAEVDRAVAQAIAALSR